MSADDLRSGHDGQMQCRLVAGVLYGGTHVNTHTHQEDQRLHVTLLHGMVQEVTAAVRSESVCIEKREMKRTGGE